MSEYKRLKRVIKSLIPRIPREEDRQYTLSDARMMITELGMQMSPDVLRRITDDDVMLDEFISSVYDLEQDIGKKVINEFATIHPDFNPRVYEEEGIVGFTVTYKGEEIIFAEYDLDKRS